MKKLLITGVHGFVGSNLVPYLREDFEIYGLDIVSPSKEGVVRTFSWEDLDAGRIPDVDAVVHLTGKAHDTANRSAADAYFRINTGLTRKIVDWYLSSPTARELVFFSTVKAAADKIHAAGCFLPIIQNDNLPQELGSRHRAALGVTSVASVTAIVVSEETGIITIVKNGEVRKRYASDADLKNALSQYYWSDLTAES